MKALRRIGIPLVPALLFCAFFVLTATQSYAVTTATFVEEALVLDSTLTLAHIAQIQPQDDSTKTLRELVVGSAPAPGTSKQLQAASIIAALRHRPETRNVHWLGSPVVSVLRKGRVIEREQLEQIISKYLESQADALPSGEIRFTSFRAPSSLILPYGKMSWQVTPSRSDLLQSSMFSIFFHVDGKPVQHCIVRGKMELFSEIVSPTKTIRRGEEILAEHLELRTRNILPIEHPYTKIDQVIGMVAKRTLSAGRPLREGDCAPAPVVREGQYVKIIAQKGKMRLSTNGVARSSGGKGDIIKVKNINSNKLIYARIQGPGIVTVEF
ncbi:MAG: flagella basal body P-ring formation protein FlgA [Desulfobulbus propionicus]|nr:MAG: flagella basal body P-ring formation protein FlgA [Desulfobulbus propionicus]